VRRVVIHIAALLACAAPALAQAGAIDTPRTRTPLPRATPEHGEDTVRGPSLPEVIVRAESIVAREASASQPTSILTRDMLDAAHVRDASDAVALAPGVFVRQYGGPGALRTFSLRGASAQQSVVLIDGVRYQSTAVGAVDLGSIPSAALRRVEIVRGGDAARFGANALGGAVNLITDPAGGPTALSARIETGSFGETSATLAGSIDGGALAANGSLTYSRADGDYPFDYREYGEQTTVRRENADLSSWFARAGLSRDVGAGVRLGASAIAFDASRGVPGAIVQGFREQLHARLDERELFAAIRASAAGDDGRWSLAATQRLNHLEYRDPDARLYGPDGIDNRYDRRESAIDARAQRAMGSDGYVEVAGGLAYCALEGNNLDPRAGGTVERLQWSASASTSWMLRDLPVASDVSVDAALRLDGFSDAPASLSPSLAVVVRPGGGALRVRAHGALNYRVPSFTEQYYLNFGNTELRPERSRSIDVGATYELTPALLVEADAFFIDSRDQIVSVPKSPLVWSAQNIARTLSRGIETALAGTAFDGHLALNVSYTRMRAEDRTEGPTDGNLLVYSPEELISALAEWRPGTVAVGVIWQHTSHRHTLPSNDPGAALPQYGTLGAHVAVRTTLGAMMLEVRVEATNILDEQYQVVRNYPMPGRALRLGIEVGYGAH
jgi:outer membrane cobalamin receptor